MSSAKGCLTRDLDGNRYIDLVASLGSVTLGYSERGQSKAIYRQLKKGSIFSLPSSLEYEVAELLNQVIPSAEKVRFAKNGTDVTSAAVRLARAYTGKNHIIACGYHGWQDWYIAGTSKNLGIPEILQNYIHNVEFGNMVSIEDKVNELVGDVAAIIIEPLNSKLPPDKYLESLRLFCTKNGIILIFDEVVTGFRVATGGVQQLYGVVPDLSCFGKGMANGFPISAIVGKSELMDLMEKVFLSGTFGGDTVSLTAAKYTIERYMKEGIAANLTEKGKKIKECLEKNLSTSGKQIFSLRGHDSWLFHNWNLPNGIDFNLVKTFFLQENFKKGLLVLATNNVMNALNSKLIEVVASTLASTINQIADNLDNGWLERNLNCEPIKPLFQIRN